MNADCVSTADCLPMSMSPLTKKPQRANGSGRVGGGAAAVAARSAAAAVPCRPSPGQRERAHRRQRLAVDAHPQRLRHRGAGAGSGSGRAAGGCCRSGSPASRARSPPRRGHLLRRGIHRRLLAQHGELDRRRGADRRHRDGRLCPPGPLVKPACTRPCALLTSVGVGHRPAAGGHRPGHRRVGHALPWLSTRRARSAAAAPPCSAAPPGCWCCHRRDLAGRRGIDSERQVVGGDAGARARGPR